MGRLCALNDKYNTRKPYVDNATFDPADPQKGLRTLNSEQKAAVNKALVPQPVPGSSKKFKKQNDKGENYGDRINDRLTKLIAGFHKKLFEDKEPLRKDPGKNFYDWSELEAPSCRR